MTITQEAVRVLSTFSSVLFSFPPSKEAGKLADQLFSSGYIVREKQRDDQLGIDRWAYKRTEKGSRAIGA